MIKKKDPTQSQLPHSATEERLRSALKSAKMALWELDLIDKTSFWSNKVIDHFYEFSKSYDGSISSYLELVHPDDKEGLIAFLGEAEKHKNFVNQHRVLWPDGTYHWLEGLGTVITENGQLKLSGTVQDITEKKKIELEREDWKTRYELVSSAAGIIVYDYNINTGNIIWSGNTLSVLGFTASDMGNVDKWVELIHPEDRDQAFAALEIAQKNLDTYEVYYRFKKSNDTYCRMYDRGTFLEKGEKAYRMLGMMSDVSHLWFAEKALKESEDQFKTLIESLHVGVGLYDEHTVPFLCNKAAYELLGMTKDQLMGQAALDENWNVLDAHGNPFPATEFPIPRAIASKKPVNQVVMGVYQPHKKSRVWLIVDAHPIFDSEGKFLHVICTYTDFTERRRIEESLAEKNEQLEHSSRELHRKNHRLMEFAQIVSHNLRSPVSNIDALIALYDKQDSSDQRETIDYIGKISQAALQTIEDLNDVLKVQQNEDIERSTINIEKQLNGVKEVLKASIADKNPIISLDISAAESIRYPEIYFESILLNLLSNALKYCSKERPLEIGISTKRKGNEVIMAFSDNGLGIDLEKHQKDIFRFGKSFHTKKDSKGIGLFLIKNQIQSMGDEITISSQVEVGTTFSISFRNQR